MKNDVLDKMIELAAREAPEFQLPDDFAKKITVKIESHVQWKNNLLEYFYMTVLAVFLLFTCVGLYYYIDKVIIINIISFVSHNLVPFVSIALLLNFVIFSDKVLLPWLFKIWDNG